MTGRRVIVSGGTGVTGNALIRCLLEDGCEVTAIIRPGSGRRGWLPESPRLTVLECPMGKYSVSHTLMEGTSFSCFYHLAWSSSARKDREEGRNDFSVHIDNIRYMVDAVELCHKLGCPAFIATGSQAEYGLAGGIVNENTLLKPVNGYGAAKQCAAAMAEILCKSYGIRFIWARLFSVYGPRDGTDTLIDTAVKRILRGERMEYTQGEQLWNYLYSYDAARAFMLLARDDVPGGTYCVAAPESRPLRDYIRILHEVTGTEPVLGGIPYPDNLVMDRKVDTHKLKEATGFLPAYGFEEGIRAVYSWYLEKDENRGR